MKKIDIKKKASFVLYCGFLSCTSKPHHTQTIEPMANQAYMPASDLEPLSQDIEGLTHEEANPSKEWYEVLSKKINVRHQHGFEEKIVGQLKQGDQVSVLKRHNGWGMIGENRWIYLENAKKL